jgi:hypothetical protein
MIFHKREKGAGFARPVPGERRRYRLDIARVLLGILLLISLLGGAYLAKQNGWEEGSWTMTHMAGVLFGLVVGAIFGEEAALRHEA